MGQENERQQEGGLSEAEKGGACLLNQCRGHEKLNKFEV